jgi:ATP-dependent Lhr-like helicase
LLDVIEQLQGAPLLASDLDDLILPARLSDYQPSDLDELTAAGEVVWRGVESNGTHDGRIALYLADNVSLLAPLPVPLPRREGLGEGFSNASTASKSDAGRRSRVPPLTPPFEGGGFENSLCSQILEHLQARGASFFDDVAATLGGFRNDLFDALWQLVWSGHVTNDTLAPLRARRRSAASARTSRRRGGRERRSFRSRRTARQPGAEGRWSLINYGDEAVRSLTARQTAVTEQLVRRYGVLVRPAVGRELVEGGFSALYPILRAMEEAGRVRRGYFVAGMGGAQFASPGTDETLRRAPRIVEPHEDNVIVLGASDPANAYGSILRWPASPVEGLQLQRGAGARVFLLDGELIGYLGRAGNHLITFAPEDPNDEPLWHEKLLRALAKIARRGAPVLISQINGQPPSASPLASVFARHGFTPTTRGYLHRGPESTEAFARHA